MRWKVSVEGSDEITRGHRFEFEIEKSLDDLAAGSLGLSIDDGKTILASFQRFLIEQQCALYVLFRRHCQGCGGTRPIKDYSTRTIQTVYGAVTVESPRLYPCRRCMPGVDFTIIPVSELCPDRATAELMTLTAKLGALMPYRAAAEVLADFLPGQMPTRHTTLRNRTLAVGKQLEEKEEQRMFVEQVDTRERRQRELPLPGDLEREFVLSIDTAHVPQVSGRQTRSFEAVICHASRGGVGSDRGILFAFSGTSRKRMRAEGLLALKRLGYEGKGDITVISDGEDCLKRLKSAILRAEGRDRFDVFSAGTRPYSEINPMTLQVLRENGHTISDLRSKTIGEFQRFNSPRMDFVFTVCDQAADEECPTWPGQPITAHWGHPDPVKLEGPEAIKLLAFRETYQSLARRIRPFAQLSFNALDRASLQSKVDELGRLPLCA